MSSEAPYGTWQSLITAELLTEGTVRLGEIVVDGDSVWWAESRPNEGGRTVIVCDGIDQLSAEANVRTLVHEYGGGAWWVSDGVLVYSEYTDQRLYKLEKGKDSVALTPALRKPGGDRYADGRLTQDRAWYVCVRERHSEEICEPVNEVVAVALDGSEQIKTLVSGPDFVAAPRPSPDGSQLAWIQWNHPEMPWDNTELWVADFDGEKLSSARCIGAEGESFFQPEWRSDGILHVVTDRDGWWHLYRFDGNRLISLTSGDFEIGVPQWVFGQSRYSFVGDGIWFARRQNGVDRLAVLNSSGTVEEIDIEASEIESVSSLGDGVVAVVSSWVTEPAVVAVTRRNLKILNEYRDLKLDSKWLPIPESVTYPTSDGEQAHAVIYPPTNPNYKMPKEELPPLLVLVHGGPTSAARRQLQLSVAYWTSRGFMVADVDYRGSTGYGRFYRDRLQSEWGVLDVDDCESVANHLVNIGRVDSNRLAIKGGSAGGFTVLAALTFGKTFTVGVSRYGIADLAVLASDTHKFESRYLDRLVGQWPRDEIIYQQRSPIYHTSKLSTPMLILQGSEDVIVPPNQAHMMADALLAAGIPHAVVEFPDEGHGFRKAPNIIRAIQAELSFFADFFGFKAADELPILDIR